MVNTEEWLFKCSMSTFMSNHSPVNHIITSDNARIVCVLEPRECFILKCVVVYCFESLHNFSIKMVNDGVIYMHN